VSQRQTRTKIATTAPAVDERALRQAFAEGRMSAAEERVLRMRYGLAEPADALLESKARGSEEARAKLAFFEMELLEEALPASPNRDAIRDALKRL